MINTNISVLDATAKPGPGILRGHIVHFGLLHECTAAKYDFKDHEFVGNYIS